MQSLRDLILERRGEIIARWTEGIRQSLAPAGATRFELTDHLPAYLDELARTLAERADGTDPSPAAAQHGVQRLRLGFDLSALVREYGMLRRCLVDMTHEAKINVSSTDWDVLFETIISGIADAVTQYSEEREADQTRQSNEHFAFVAHELRNPLSVAQLSMGNLKIKGLMPQTRSAEVLKRSLDRMQQLVEQSLEHAIGTAAGVALQRAPETVDELIAEAAVEARALAEEKGVAIEWPAPAEIVLNVDRKLVLSALNNLLRNAVKFTPPGGRICVRVLSRDHLLRIEVEDGCGGIPPQDLEALFVPFVQGGKDRSGFGLGLSIAKNAAVAHGGTIDVTNLPGQGCIFVLQLPLNPG